MAIVEADHEHVGEPAQQVVAGAGGSAVIAPTPAPTIGAADPGSPWVPRSWAWTALGVDVLMLAATVFTAQLITRQTDATRMSLLWVLGFAAVALGLLYKRGLYDWRVRLQTLDDLSRVVMATVLALAGILALRMLLGRTEDVSAQSVRLWALAAAYLVAGRLALQWLRFETRVGGDSAKPTLIIGAGKVGQLVANRLLEHPEFGLRPVGFLDKEPLADPDAPVPILGASWDLEQMIEEHGIEHVIVAFSTAPSEVLLREVQRCELAGVGVSLVPRLFEYMTERVTVDHIGGLPLVSARRTGPNGWQFAVKYAFDRVLAAFLLVLLSPLLLLLAIGVALSTGWPVLFRQTRVGLGGREFEIVKFRTMTHMAADPPELEEVLMVNIAPGGVEGVDRRTRFGSLIRRLSLDELPQLINVVKGEMSLIGPRPERPHFVEIFQRTIPRYADRHRVRPGITGWAQIHGLRGKTSLSDRIEWDNYYVENWSLWLDFKIMLTTMFILGHHSKQTE
ncbi:MAG TPA: exopolysaccharide biosynthesis polyprenyl glycosylphosphotransferase [Gaiellaceae bacterium]|nr:exopolysaccharide biosynthesis polyprenyl glycosylphosphotransferase [Gaiellaceae bacterium]